MKLFYKSIFAVAVLVAGVSAHAQLRWDPAKWTNKTPNQRVEIVNNGKAVKVVPMANDNAHIRNKTTINLSEDEPYLIVKIAVDHEFAIARNYSGWCFYNQFRRNDGTPLTDAEKIKLNDMVFHNQYFYQTPGLQRILFDDNDMFTPGVPFDVFVLDLNDPKYNILSNGDLKVYPYIDYTDYNEDYQLQSYISFDMCCWGRDGADKNIYLQANNKGASYGVTYEYIATAGMYDILDTDELVDPLLVKELIDNYKNGTSLVEVRPGEESEVGGVDDITADSSIRILGTRGGVRAHGATEINVYNLAGVNVASVNDEKVSVAPGFYIVRATDADGNVETAKVRVR
ncbi:MAG: hypothetical protein K2L41_09595 [Muribaculaceae bacterium]|nr:hypothetical protein [Muribaculaceae bacterium]